MSKHREAGPTNPERLALAPATLASSVPLSLPPELTRAGVAVCARPLDEPVPPLMAEERDALGVVAEKRFVEFRAGRAAARCALAALGVPGGPILPGPDRVPRFPEGIVGSISHCSSHVFAAVARKGDVGGLGV